MTEGEFQKQLKKYHKTGEMPVELAVKLLSECTTNGVYDDETEEAKFMAIKALEQAPKTGHWIKIQKTQKGCHDCTVITYEYHCSECDSINVSPYKNFCPNCGARMKGRTEE